MLPMTKLERDCLLAVSWLLIMDATDSYFACQFLMGMRGRCPLDNDYRNQIVWC